MIAAREERQQVTEIASAAVAERTHVVDRSERFLGAAAYRQQPARNGGPDEGARSLARYDGVSRFVREREEIRANRRFAQARLAFGLDVDVDVTHRFLPEGDAASDSGAPPRRAASAGMRSTVGSKQNCRLAVNDFRRRTFALTLGDQRPPWPLARLGVYYEVSASKRSPDT